MNPVLTVLAKTVCGGVLVLAFAALAEMVGPKRFAGILGAAPSVAIAGLVIGTLADGASSQALAARTMIAGALGLTVYSAVAVRTLRRFGAGKGVVLAGVGWLVVAGALYPLVAP
jgi:4-amino-4-deoxy-L-arabinose transferase-like glycosyltransferase